MQPVKPESERILGNRGAALRRQDRLPPPTGPKIPVGCFAPPLDDATLARYRTLVGAVSGEDELKEALQACLVCVEAWWQLEESDEAPGQPITVLHRGRETSFREVPLRDDHVERLWDVTPWLREVDSMKALFERISPTARKELRDCAHHLLWHVQELALYREPLTSDVLKS